MKITTLHLSDTRGKLDKLRTALKETFPATVHMKLCFTGKNTLEVLCNVKHAKKLIYVMNKLRMRLIRSESQQSPTGPDSAHVPT